jgi:hypothetical protein
LALGALLPWPAARYPFFSSDGDGASYHAARLLWHVLLNCHVSHNEEKQDPPLSNAMIKKADNVRGEEVMTTDNVRREKDRWTILIAVSDKADGETGE